MRTNAFLELASKVYEIFQENLIKNGSLDFDVLINRAVEKIEETNGNCEIRIGRGGDNATISLNQIRHLMIDEYQDFSELFFRLVNSMKRYNPEMSVYAVGDKRQAINALAGSDLKFFQSFSQFFGDGKLGTLLKNYKNKNKIVENGNPIMRGIGDARKPYCDNVGGEVIVEDVEDVWLHLPTEGEEMSLQTRHDLKFLFRNNEQKIDFRKIQTSRYLRRCYEIISTNLSLTCIILNRTNRFPDGTTINQFSEKLRCGFPSQDKRMFQNNEQILTVHRSKGRESDSVILLNAVRGRFMLIHSNSTLFEIFGDSVEEIINEERRLFYVACTRARNTLHIISEENNKTDFLK
jgi:DNA helicase-4